MGLLNINLNRLDRTHHIHLGMSQDEVEDLLPKAQRQLAQAFCFQLETDQGQL